ncbi:MAG: hypothetical protein JNL83_33960 [Myxococcales bacterium]|nr:hypothetical protein [Myxococcales bacterium]
MHRRAVILVALAACSKEPPEGVSLVTNQDVAVDGRLASMGLGFTVKLAAPLPDSRGITVRAACQVGADRLVDVAQPAIVLEPGRAVKVDVPLFEIERPPARPSRCDYEIWERGVSTSRLLYRRCGDADSLDRPCPPNVISRVAAGPTGVTAVVSHAVAKAATLQLRYRATAHRDLSPGAQLVRMTSCPGHRNDDAWHDIGFLRTGESRMLSALADKVGRPAPGTACETVLGYAPEPRGEITELATFCHRDAVITPGECPR